MTKRFTNILLFLLLLSGGLLGLEWIGPWIILLGGTLIGGGVIVWKVPPGEKRYVLEVFLAAVLLRVCTILPFFVLSYTGVGFHPGFFFASDGYGYHENGWQIAQLWEKGLLITPKLLIGSFTGTMPSPYEFWNAFIYSFTGKSPLSLFFVNALVGVWSSLFVFLFTEKFFGRRAARLAMLFSAFWPSLLFWSIQNLRDPMVNLAIFLLMWSALELRYRLSVRFIFTGLISSYVLFKFRMPVCLLILFLIFIWFLGTSQFYRKMKLLFIVLLVFISVAQGLKFWKNLEGAFKQKMAKASVEAFYTTDVSIAQWVDYLRTARASGGSAFLKGVDFTNPKQAIVYLPAAMGYALFAPFPWQGGSGSSLLGAFEMSILYLCLPFILGGIRHSLRVMRDQTFLILLVFSFLSLLLALIEGNVGTLFRHRSMMLSFILIFIAVGLSHPSRKVARQNV
ncbi:MAG: glycosyltransferase family 39 protein [Candidatus Omnitrophica bacterium]|nr:glycosyltransferase family 39 protein [Candidatus Omnitrophota bacterium]